MAVRGRRLLTDIGCACLCAAVWIATTAGAAEQTLPGTSPLQMPENVVQDHVARMEAYFQRQFTAAECARERRWPTPQASAEDLAAYVRSQRQVLRDMLGLQLTSAKLPAVQVEVIVSQPALRLERITIPMVDGPAARGLLFTPHSAHGQPVVIVCADADQWPEQFTGVAGDGRLAAWTQQLLVRGASVYVPQSIERRDDHPYCQQIKAAVGLPDSAAKDRRWILYRLGYVVGHSLPGLDVQDVLAAVEYLASRPEIDPERMGVAGIGQGGMTALYAAALDSRLSASVVTDYFSNRKACADEPVDRRLPGQLVSCGDAEVSFLVAPRPLTIVQSCRSAIPADTVHAECSRARQIRQRVYVGDSLDVVAVPPESDAVELTVATLADRMHLIATEPTPTWPLCVVPTEHAAATRNIHFEERLAWLREQVARSEAERYERWGLLTRPAAESTRIQAAMLSEYRQQVGEVSCDGRPLRPRTELALVTDKYRAYRVMLDVTDEIEVYGNLLVPCDLGERTAAVICQHGLSGRPEMITGLGMTDDTPYHEFGRHLAEQGYVVFAPLILHYHPVDITNRQALQADALGRMRVALVRLQTERVLDFLQSLPCVDPERIGYYGLSYGGYSAIWLAPLVPRLKAIVISGHFNDWRSKITADDVPTSYLLHPDEDFYNWDILHRFTHVELIAMTVPRPVCVEFGERDGITSPAWTASAWQQVRDIESHWGQTDRVELAHYDGVHEIHGIQSFDFLNRHLRGDRRVERDYESGTLPAGQRPYVTHVLDADPASVVTGSCWLPAGAREFRGMAVRLSRTGDPGPVLMRFGTAPGLEDVGVATRGADQIGPLFEPWCEFRVPTRGVAPHQRVYWELRCEHGLAPAHHYVVYGPRPLGGRHWGTAFGLSYSVLTERPQDALIQRGR